MKNNQPQAKLANWKKVVFLSAIIGLLAGVGFWWWQQQSSEFVISNNQSPAADSNQRAAQNNQSVTSSNNLPIANQHLESISDKLAEASLHLREQHNDYARQALVEAHEIAVRTEDNPQLLETLLGGIKQAQTSVANGRIEEAEETVSRLLDQLNMTGN